MQSDKNRLIYIFFTVIAIGCSIIWVFTNVGYDCEYQIAMCYRLLQGDKMFLEMWEPHQTSVFLPAALMWIYRKILGTNTGIVIYLQICGMLIRGGIAVLLYRTLRGDLQKRVAFGIALFYFMISPKDCALPEFSNQQVWYSALLFCCLWTYFKKEKKIYLILSAIWLSLEVLAYPSCAIVFIGVLILLALYSAHGKRDILIMTALCALMGVAVGGYFVISIGADKFTACISGMLSLEPTHTQSLASRLAAYGKDIFGQFIILTVVGVIGYLIYLPVRMVSNKKGKKKPGCSFWLLCCCVILLIGFLANIISAENRYAYSMIFLLMVGLGLGSSKELDRREKQIYVCSCVIGGFGALSALMLSNLPFSASVPYGLLMISVSFIPIERQIAKISNEKIIRGFYACMVCFVMLLAFRCVYIRTPLTGKGQICSSLSGMALVRSGPALGLISNEEGVCIQRDSYLEWKEWIRPGDKVWILGGVADTLGYLYEDVEVAGPSTISTPSYSEAVLAYWDLNPDKYPDVIVAESYMGNLSYDLLVNQWLVDWIETEYQPEQVIDGKYWKYYFKTAR